MNYNIELEKETRNYGPLTDVSKATNQLLGDSTGRTVSMRTAQGFKKSLNLNISDNDSEDIAHLLMIASVISLIYASKNSDGAKVIGLILLIGLIFFYLEGK